jgi:hypothetical protein
MRKELIPASKKEKGGLLRFIFVLFGIVILFVILFYTGFWNVMSTPDRLFAILAGLIVILLLGIKPKKNPY